MAETAAGDRGSLTIQPRVVERIAEATAVRVRGVLRRDATFGRGLPKAKAVLAGQRARLDMEVAVEWGYALPEIAAELRDAVGRAAIELTGLGVDAVGVDITAVELPSTTSRSEDQRRVT